MTLDYRPSDPAVLADPFGVYRRLRDEDPAHWSPRLKAWVLTRYEDVKRVCLDTAGMSSDRLRPFFATLPSAEAARMGELIRILTLWMVFRDPPEHTRLRRLASRVFHVRSIHALRPNVEALTQWLLERIGERASFDFIAEFAGPLPALVIMDMLGVPRADLPRLKRLSDEMALFIGSARAAADKYERAEAATHEMADLFRSLIKERRASRRADLLSDLVHLEEDGDRLTEDELVAMCVLLLFAGHETTTHHIANGLAALMRFPAEMEKLRRNPALAPAAVEELLRYDGPVQMIQRIALDEVEVGGVAIPKGSFVVLCPGAANRDPAVFAHPDRLDVARAPKNHVAFGNGAHFCIGAPLARAEARVAVGALVRRLPNLRVTTRRPRWRPSFTLRGLAELPLGWDAA